MIETTDPEARLRRAIASGRQSYARGFAITVIFATGAIAWASFGQTFHAFVWIIGTAFNGYMLGRLHRALANGERLLIDIIEHREQRP
jgi:predicted metal-binding membrane protein